MASTTRDIAQQRERHIEVARRFFELLAEGEIAAWAHLWHDEGRIIVPYPPDGFPSVIEGKARVLEDFHRLFALFTAYEPELTGLYACVDSDAICVEYGVRASLAGGDEYTNDNIAVFRFRDGLVLAYHDYFDPRRFQPVVDALGAS